MYKESIDQAWDIAALEKEQQKAVDLVKGYLDVCIEASQASRMIGTELKGVTTLKGLADKTNEARQATANHKKAVDDLSLGLKEYEKIAKQKEILQARLNVLDTEAAKETAKMREELRAQNKELSLNAQINNTVTGSIEEARKRVIALRLERDKLNLSTEEGRRRQAALNTEIDQHNTFIRINNDTLSKQKINIGNYASGTTALGHSIQQVARELPSLSNGINTFGSAISNNIPIAVDHWKAAVAVNKQLKEEGKATVPVFQQALQSIFSWQTALVVALTLFATYGKDIKNFFTGVSKATEDAEKANKKYAQSLETIETSARATANEEIARLRVLEKIATDSTNSLHNRKKAVDEMQRLYPDYLKNIKDEAILQGQAKDKINEVTEALMQKAMAAAAERKFAAASERVYDLTLAQRKAEEELTKARADRMRVRDKMNEEDTDGLDFVQASEKVASALKAKSEIEKDLASATANAEVYLADAQKMGAKAFGLFTPKGSTATPKPTDTTNTEIKALQSINESKAQLLKTQIEKENFYYQLVFNNENQSYENRLAALRSFTENKQILNNIDQQTEVKNVQAALKEIEEIESKAGDRTPQQKKLLEQKEALQWQLVAITEKGCVKEEEIIADSAGKREQIEKQTYDKRISMQKEAIDELKNANEKAHQEELRELVDRYEKGEISTEEYEQGVLDINDKYQKNAIQMLIEFLKKLLETQKLGDKDRLHYQNMLADAENQLEDKKNSERVKKRRQLNDQLKKLYKELYDASLSIMRSITAAEQQEIDARIKQAQDSSERGIKAIETEYDKKEILAKGQYDNEEEREKAIEQIKLERLAAITSAQKKAESDIAKLENDKRQAAIRQAKFEKQMAILQIVVETAKAVASLLKNPPAAAVAAAAGAVQLAAVMAQPIPQYKEGTEHHIGGPAIVGDGYERELITEPGRMPYWSPAAPTLIPAMPAGTSVVPISHMQAGNNDFAGMREDFKGMAKGVEKAISNIKQTTVIHKGDEIYRIEKQGSHVTNFLSKKV